MLVHVCLTFTSHITLLQVFLDNTFAMTLNYNDATIMYQIAEIITLGHIVETPSIPQFLIPLLRLFPSLSC